MRWKVIFAIFFYYTIFLTFWEVFILHKNTNKKSWMISSCSDYFSQNLRKYGEPVLHFPAKQHKNRLFYCFCMRCTVPDKAEKTTQFRGKPKLRGFLKMFRGGEWGIRTLVPLRTTAFRVQLVMTTSITLQLANSNVFLLYHRFAAKASLFWKLSFFTRFRRFSAVKLYVPSFLKKHFSYLDFAKKM